MIANPEIYNRFDTLNYINVVAVELSPVGNFHQIENRIAGDPTHNGALPGSFGGMYDNFGYDRSEEAHSISRAVGVPDAHRSGPLYLRDAARSPPRRLFTRTSRCPTGRKLCRDRPLASAGRHRDPRGGTDLVHPDQRLATTARCRRPHRQALSGPADATLFQRGTQRVLCGPPYGGMWWDLIFHDGALAVDPPGTNPTADLLQRPRTGGDAPVQVR